MLNEKEGIVYCESPITTDRYDFMLKHPLCNFIIEDNTDKEDDDSIVNIIAYAENEEYNYELVKQYRHNKRYRIVVGVDLSEPAIL